MSDKKGTLVVAGKSFSYVEGEDSELEAGDAAKRHLREYRRAAVARILPAPGSNRRTPRRYDPVTGEPFVNDKGEWDGRAFEVDRDGKVTITRTDPKTGRVQVQKGDVVLNPGPARMRVRGK